MVSLDVHPFICFTYFLVPRCCLQMIDNEPPTHKHLSVSQVVFVIYTLLLNTQASGFPGPIKIHISKTISISFNSVFYFFNVCFLPLQQPYDQMTTVSMAQQGPGFSYNQAHFQPGHGQHAVMMRQKSIGTTYSHMENKIALF